MKNLTLTTMVLFLFAAAAASAAPVLDNVDCGKAETAVGDLVADAFRTTMKGDVAFVSAGDLRPESMTIEGGTVKPEHVTALLQFPNDNLVVLALNGRMIREALEKSVSSAPKPTLSFLQVSGLKMTYDPAKPAGQRVTSATIAGSRVTDEKSYKVVMLNSLANGALGYWKVWSKRNIISSPVSSTSADAIATYLRTNPRIDFAPQGRIVSK